MADEKKSRSMQELQQDYQAQSLRAGHLAYQIDALKKELAAVFDMQRDLNLEAAKVEAEAKAAPAPAPEEPKAE